MTGACRSIFMCDFSSTAAQASRVVLAAPFGQVGGYMLDGLRPRTPQCRRGAGWEQAHLAATTLRWSRSGGDGIKMLGEEKTGRKALIPLPPTGFASLFCAKAGCGAVELMRIAERLSLTGNEPDAQAIYRMITILQSDEARLQSHVAEIAGALT